MSGGIFLDGAFLGGSSGGGSGDVTKVGTPVDDQVGIWTGDGTIEGDAGLTFNGTSLFTGILSMLERAASAGDIAGSGQVWVKNTTPNELWFTNDAGTDVQLGVVGGGGGDVTKVGTPVNDQLGVWTGNGTIEGDTSLTWDGSDLTITNGANDPMAMFNTLANKISTGIQNGGGLLTINGDNTKFDISDGVGYIVDNYTSEAAPVPLRIAFSGLTAITATFVVSDNVSFIAINSSGTVIQQNTPFTVSERTTMLVLGALVHPGSVITATSDESLSFGSSKLSDDTAHALGDINMFGNNYLAASTDLTIKKQSGESFKPNDNRDASPTNPNFTVDVAQDPVTFLYVYNDGSGGVTVVPGSTDIDPQFYDDGSGVLAATSNNKWTNHICYWFPSSEVFIVRYGTVEYNSESDAIAAALLVPSTIGTGLDPELARTVISVKRGETDLTSTDTSFTDTGKFGLGSAGGSAGGSGDVFKSGAPVSEQIAVWTADGIIEGVAGFTFDGTDLVVPGLVDGRDLATDGSKLDGVEALADVTDTANVTSAGALMDSEVDADIKTLVLPASTTISTFGASLVDDSAASNARTTLELVIGTDVQAHDAVLDATTASFLTADETKLDAIEALADVTDVTNVTSAGALMDSELTDITAVKALDQGVAAADSPTFVAVNADVILTIPTSDHTASGITQTITVGEGVDFGDLLYLNSDGKWWKSDANSVTTMPGLRLALATEVADDPCEVLVTGLARDDSWAWTVGGLIYASGTAGSLTQSHPATAGDQVQVIGVATHADRMSFQPSLVLVEVS